MDNLYYDYPFVRNTVWTLKTKYPFLQVKSIGKSVAGRDIFVLEIGKTVLPKVLYVSGMKGTDRFAAALLLRFINAYCEAVCRHERLSGMDAEGFLSQQGIAALPMLNPDGCEIAARGFAFAGENAAKLERLCGGEWKTFGSNARGVDLTENFPPAFERRKEAAGKKGIYGPSRAGYPGKAAFSEPESSALGAYVRENAFCHCLTLFCGKGEILWRDEKPLSKTAAQMAKIFAASSGYAFEAELGPASAGAFRRWFSRETERPALDIAVKEPTAEESIGAKGVYARLEELLSLAAVM